MKRKRSRAVRKRGGAQPCEWNAIFAGALWELFGGPPDDPGPHKDGKISLKAGCEFGDAGAVEARGHFSLV